MEGDKHKKKVRKILSKQNSDGCVYGSDADDHWADFMRPTKAEQTCLPIYLLQTLVWICLLSIAMQRKPRSMDSRFLPEVFLPHLAPAVLNLMVL